MPIPADKQGDWHDALDLKLYRTHGEEFENFFATMMEMRHGEEFERVAASGRAGDRKCDGFLHTTAEVFQCYGAAKGGENRKSVNKTLTKKMETDYRGAARHWTRMTRWHMVHNFVDGPTAEPLAKIEELRLANPQHQLHLFGKMSFKKVIFALEEPDVVRLIGRAATLADFENLQPPEVVAVLHAVVKAISDDLPEDDDAASVPRDKLRYNAITGAVARKIAMGQTNADIVRAHILNDPNPLLGITLANEFRRRYKDLDLQDLTSNEIMLGLYDGIVGTGNPTQERDVAAWSLLAYLFDACTVFKDRPPIEVAA
ncbi:hypothetical protein PUR29_25825 [Methylobacterium ajmalii]|jgi:hypothetical protein|uniref:ABC-three component systems C-terminal domain-containing protein n=2 Tax=Methylobacterium TaxID=407 RepID=A0A0J6VD96_9HYPH|nr:ABC-three component system protein [Methylobacterium aquaticum]KMO37011.1 hypothetical protein VP06_08580 [Methylobacterium aquaticum]